MTALYLLFLYFLLSRCSLAPCKVAFRIDDIQSEYIEAVQMAVLNVFLDRNVPITLGVISGTGIDASFPGGIMELIKNKLSTGLIELASHSANHSDFTTLTLEQQTYDLQESARLIKAGFPAYANPIKTFITPYNRFNTATLSALAAAGYNTISSSYANSACVDQPFFYESCSAAGLQGAIYHFPQYPESSLNGDPPVLPIQTTLDKLQAQLDACNATERFSVVMLHFVEYSLDNSGAVGRIDQLALNSLIQLVTTVQGLGCDLRLMQAMPLAFGATSNAPTLPTPTNMPTPTSLSVPTSSSVPTLSSANINAIVAAALDASDFSNNFFTCNNVTFTIQPTTSTNGIITFIVTCPSTCDQTTVCNLITQSLYSRLSSTLSPPPCRGICLSCSLNRKKRDEDATSTVAITIPAGYNMGSGIISSLVLMIFALFIAL